MSARVTSRDYAHPYRPPAIATLNRLATTIGRTRPLRAQALIAAARRSTGLHDFGDPPLEEPLERLVDALETEAAMHPVGRAMTRIRLGSVLRQRLRAQALFDTHPEILETPLAPPVVVTGLQRSGTTMLSRLLAADPQARSLASWEALEPVPRHPGDDGRARRRAARTAERALKYLAPDFFAVHPVEADSPEEEVVLLDLTLLSTVAEATYHVPSYAAWVETQDQTPAYRYLDRMLRLLAWQRGGGASFWVLKSPHHLEWIDTLLEVFPGTRVVLTSRDPAITLPSFCSMVCHGRGVFSDAVDPHAVGEHWLRKVARLVARAEASRARAPAGTFLDVDYDTLIADPARTLRRVYTHIDRPAPTGLDAQVRDWLTHNHQHRHGKHVYDASDFGLDAARIARAFDQARATAH